MTTPTIKFRGVRIDNGEYVYGSLLHYHPNYECGILNSIVSPTFGHLFNTIQVHPDSVAQYTCMNDKNGKEIYGSIYLDGKLTKGGDIVRDGNKLKVVEFGIHEYEEDFGNIILYSGWNIKFGFGYTGLAKYEYEVLGSLFLNPELLK